MQEFCSAKNAPEGYVVTKNMTDFGVMPLSPASQTPVMLKIPALLRCYWLGRSEIETREE